MSEQIGNFRVIRELGRGGMGVVYEALDQTTNKHVAIKMVQMAQQFNKELSKRFLREVNVVKGLQHPNIVRVYQVGIKGNNYYMVMDLIEGQALNKLMFDKPLPLGWALGTIAQIARALAYAHDRGIIHRDIKPENILIDKQKIPYLMDFGLARSSEEPELTLTGHIMGSPKYMSPEQAAGNFKHMDCRSDVYSLGVVLYEMFAGRHLVEGNSIMEILASVIRTTPTPLPQIIPGFPEDIDSLWMKAIAKEPAQRYQSAAAFAEAIEKLLQQKKQELPDLETRIRTSVPMIDKTEKLPHIAEHSDTRPPARISSVLQNLQLKGQDFIKGYDILKKIGEGGMGVVYLAHQISLNRMVAIKILDLSKCVTQKDRDRFVQEGRAMAQLNHPNLIQPHDLGNVGDLYYLIMEYVEGIPLNKFVKDAGALSEERAVALIQQAIDGLSQIWKRGLVHCDIKPANIILSKENVVKVGDLGLVRQTTMINPQGEVLGTPHYMSPEQMRGDEVDYRSDVYALGATMYYLVSGFHPFHGTQTIQIARSMLQGITCPPLSTLAGVKVSPALENLVTRWMSLEPTERCESQQAVPAMLAHVAQKIEPGVSTAPRTVSGVKRSLKNFTPAISSPLVKIGLLVVLCVLGWLIFAGGKSPEEWITLIPKESWLVISTDGRSILKIPQTSEDIQALEKRWQAGLQLMGIDTGEKARYYLYLSGQGDTLHMGMVVKGKFSRVTFERLLRSSSPTNPRYLGYHLLPIAGHDIITPLLYQSGARLLRELEDVQNALKSQLFFTLLDENTIALGAENALKQMVACYKGQEASLVKNVDMADQIEKHALQHKNFWMIGTTTSRIDETLCTLLMHYVPTLAKSEYKANFMELQYFMLTLDLGDTYRFDCVGEFGSQKTSQQLADVFKERFDTVKDRLKEADITDYQHFEQIALKAEGNKIRMSFTVGWQQAHLMLDALRADMPPEGLAMRLKTITAQKVWHELKAKPEKNLADIQTKLESYRGFLVQYKDVEPGAEVSNECSRLEKVVAEKHAAQALEKLATIIDTQTHIQQWDALTDFIAEHPGTEASRQAQSMKDSAINAVREELEQTAKDAQSLINQEQYSQVIQLPGLEQWLSPAPLQQKLLAADPKTCSIVDTLRTLMEKAQDALQKRLSGAFDGFCQAFSQDMKERNYQEAQQKAQEFAKRLTSAGEETLEASREIEQDLQDIESIRLIWQEVRARTQQSIDKPFPFGLKDEKTSHWGILKRVEREHFYVKIGLAEVGYKLMQLDTATVVQLVRGDPATHPMQENIAVFCFWEGEARLAEQTLNGLMAENPSARCQRLQLQIKKLLATQDIEQEKALQQIHAQIDPLIEEAFKSQNSDHTLSLLKSLKTKIGQRDLWLRIARELQHKNRFLGNLAEQARTKCSTCSDRGTIAKTEQRKLPPIHQPPPPPPGQPPRHTASQPRYETVTKNVPCPSCSHRRNSSENKALEEFYKRLDEDAVELK